jgi:hypothetical protein
MRRGGLLNAPENSAQGTNQQQDLDQSQARAGYGQSREELEEQSHQRKELSHQSRQATPQLPQNNNRQTPPKDYTFTHYSLPKVFDSLEEMEEKRFHLRRQMANPKENFGLWYIIRQVREGQFAVAQNYDKDSSTPEMVKILPETMCLRYESDDVTRVLTVGDFVQIIHAVEQQTEVAAHITALCTPVTDHIYFGQISDMDNQRMQITCPQYAKISPESYLFHYYLTNTEQYGDLRFRTVIFRGSPEGMYVEGWSCLVPRFEEQVVHNVPNGYEYINMGVQERKSNHFTLAWHRNHGQKELVFMVKNTLLDAGVRESGNEARGYYDRDWVRWLQAHENGFLAEIVPSIPVDEMGNRKCKRKYTMGQFKAIQ